MQYQNELFQSTNPPENTRKKHQKPLLIGICSAIIATASYAFFSPEPEQLTPENITLTIPDIAAQIDTLEPSDALGTNINDDLTNASTLSVPEKLEAHSMQSFSTVWQEHKIKSGESLSVIFSKNKLSKSDLHKIIHANDISSQFASIRPGKSLMIGYNISGQLSHLIYKKNSYDKLKATRLDDGDFKVEHLIKEATPKIASASGTIHTSLFIDGKNAGLSDKTIMQLTNIFAWDIDFAHSIRDGDKFAVIYEKLYIDGQLIGMGNILAAEFLNRDHMFRSIRYKDASGKVNYYSPKGNSMRKEFLRTPIDFARISSHFNLRRKHPVLNRIRAHKGVDYAASQGTPIKSTGDGKITFRGRKGGYGNVIIIQHGQSYSTLYAHMSKFKRGLRVGSHIYQGQVIGFVGKTGLASGNHLHYEFRVNGVHRNPLTVKLPNASPIKAKYKEDFLAKSKSLLSQLKQLGPTEVASSVQLND
ncbi:MAG: peptidoglycan DD-metalloendopeptidase family protein [Methyloprofundus sp.]|nr:peptidoglycan DD-metalloendopeptidase family protein [Methyloprofundus sp.]